MGDLYHQVIMALNKKWVLPRSFLLHGHCAPHSFTSYKFFILCPMSHVHIYALTVVSPYATWLCRFFTWDICMGHWVGHKNNVPFECPTVPSRKMSHDNDDAD